MRFNYITIASALVALNSGTSAFAAPARPVDLTAALPASTTHTPRLSNSFPHAHVNIQARRPLGPTGALTTASSKFAKRSPTVLDSASVIDSRSNPPIAASDSSHDEAVVKKRGAPTPAPVGPDPETDVPKDLKMKQTKRFIKDADYRNGEMPSASTNAQPS